MGWPEDWTDLDPLPEGEWERWLQETQAGTWWVWWVREGVDGAFARNLPPLGKGIPKCKDRLKAQGNGQVPLCAVIAWQILKERLEAT